MQGAGEGRELSITFQTSGKAVRLSAPEKWRKAVIGEDLKPDTWVEIHRLGGSPQTMRADAAPELHALFFELGLVKEASPAETADEVGTTAEPAVVGAIEDDAAPRPAPSTAVSPPPTVVTWRSSDAQPAKRGSWLKTGLQIIVALVMLTTILRACGRVFHHPTATAAPPGQVQIALDSPASLPAPSAGPPVAVAPADGGPAASPTAPVADGATRTDAAGPSFNCARVTSETLKLICVTPDLAAADRALATAYQQALDGAADPAALRDSERAWIAARNAAAADADQLRGLYAERIQALREQVAAKAPEPF